MKYAYTTLSFAALALAETYQVQVGPGQSYSPESVTAVEGDIVQFTFGSGHNVVSGPFDQPCQPDGMIYSGEPEEGDVFSVTVSSSDPMWIYCSVPMHCERGMAMVINPPSEGNTLDAYKSASSEVSGSSAPEEVVGGTFDAVSEDGDDDDNNNDDNSDDNNDNDNDDSNDDDDNDNAESSGAPSMSSAVESAVSASALESAATAAATGQGAGGEEDTGEDSAAGGLVTPLSLICGAAMGAAALML